jgi:ABC-type transporter Mla subunit MlaD
MSDTRATAEAERSWLVWLGQRDDQFMTYLNSYDVNTALTLEQIQAIMSTLDQHMQDLNKARQAADELSRQGAPTFGQRLDAAIQSLQTTRSTFQQMYMSTAATQAQIAQIQQRTSDAVGQIYRDIADDSIRTRNQSHQEYMDRQYGNCFICHTYIGIPGGGYCWRHVPRR